MQDKWNQITTQLTTHNATDLIHLNPGATDEQIKALEDVIGLSLPESMKSFYRIHNGQSGGFGLFFGLAFLPLESIAENWQEWTDLLFMNEDEDILDSMASEPEGYVKTLYANSKWIPFTHDQSGNHMGVDFDPDTEGTAGQVITFGRDDDIKVVKANSFEAYIEKFIDELNSLSWEMYPDAGWVINDAGFSGHYHEWYTDRAVVEDESESESEFEFPGETCTVGVFEKMPVNYQPDPSRLTSEEEGEQIGAEIYTRTFRRKFGDSIMDLQFSVDLLQPLNRSHYPIVEQALKNLDNLHAQCLHFLRDDYQKQPSERLQEFLTECEQDCALSADEVMNKLYMYAVEFIPQYPQHGIIFYVRYRGDCDAMIALKHDTNGELAYMDLSTLYETEMHETE